MSLYDDLGVATDATPAAIKAAHRRAAKKHHPDKGGDREAFDRIQRAAVVLRDPERRARYDRDGTIDDQPDRSRSASIEVLATAFQKVLQGGGDLAAMDLVADVQAAIKERRSGRMAKRREVDGILSRLKEAIGRLGHKGKGEDILGSILAQQLREVEAARAELEKQITACDEADAMAADYVWQFDPAARQAQRRPPAAFDIITVREMEEMLRQAAREMGKRG